MYICTSFIFCLYTIGVNKLEGDVYDMILKFESVSRFNDRDLNEVITGITSFRDVLKRIDRMRLILGYSDSYIAILTINKEEYKSIPIKNDYFKKFDRCFGELLEWDICFNLDHEIIYEGLLYPNDRWVLKDYYEEKISNLASGDVLYSVPDRRYYLLMDIQSKTQINKNNFYCGEGYPLLLLDSDFVPLYFIRRVYEGELDAKTKRYYKSMYHQAFIEKLAIEDDRKYYSA